MGIKKERRKLEAIVADKSLPKAERKAAKARLAVLQFNDGTDGRESSAALTVENAEAVAAKVDHDTPAVVDARDVPQGPSHQPAASPDALPGETEPEYQWRSKANKDQLERHQAHLARVEELALIIADPATKKKARAAAEAELEGYRLATAERQVGNEGEPMDDEPRQPEREQAEDVNHDVIDPADDEARKERLKAKRAARKAGDTAERIGANPPDEVDPRALVGPADVEDEPVQQVAEVVETEHGREFAVGAPAEEQTENLIDRDYLGRPKIVQLGADGQPVMVKGEVKTKAYTRVTTYIDCLEDTSTLEKWKLRMALEGVVLDDLDALHASPQDSDTYLAKVRAAVEARDKAFAKIAKRESKGELELGQFGLLRAEATKAYKDALDAIASDAMERAGVHEKAAKGTNLHALTAMLDEGKISLSDDGQLEDLIEGGLATHSDIADLKVYARTMAELGIEHFAVEQFVVLDDLGVAGTLDRGSMFKLPGSSRRIRLVSDIKTGRIDYSAGKIGMQLKVYSSGRTYDPASPAERGDLKLSKSKGLLIHLPQGEARCEVYVVDLDLAGQGVELAGKVRSWRNVGKRVFDLRSPLKAEAVSA